MARDGCIYCGDRELTNEHAMPDWIDEMVTRYDGGVNLGYVVEGLPWTARPDIRVRRVCRTCNGWMNDEFEGPAQTLLPPLIEGHALVMPPDVQLTVAAWATKTAFMCALAGEPDIPEKWEYEYLRSEALPPETVIVSAGLAIPPALPPEIQPPHRADPRQQFVPPPHPPRPGTRRVIGIGLLLLIVDRGAPGWVEQVRDVQRPGGAFPRLHPPTGYGVPWPAIGQIETRSFVHYATKPSGPRPTTPP